MSGFGTGLSRILSVVVLIGVGLAALGALCGLAVAGMAIVDPALLENGTVRLNGEPVRLSLPGTGFPIGVTIALVCAFGGTLLWQLLGMLRSAAAGTPFIEANVRRLRIVAVLFGAVVLVQAASLILPDLFRDIVNMREARVDLGSLFSALMALVLAEVFRVGIRLREDAEGTI